ncbi:MAG: endonuclease/exonuclease/phosphatase family protein [Chitinophagaceae bacterium]|jgi:endonuclease/exonuclease/phosphatase family metal-dependent hydrolase|nr:endonuclease/exonuclease/phosphatase family protein [Chitinophagaceae bacterium]
MKRLLRLFTKQIVWIVNILVVVLLLCTKFIPFVNPNKIWAIGILGLATPFIAVANILFIILWMLFAKWRRLLLSAIAIVLCWNIFSVGIAGNIFQKNVEQNSKLQLKIMSYNVRLLDYYKWSGNKDTRSKMLEFIRQQNADILCLQEFFSSQDSTGIQNVKAICDSCNYSYAAANKNFITKRGFFGDIIFSKLPIVHQESMQLDTSTLTHRYQYADVVWQADTFRVYNLHLQSVRFDKQDIALLNNKENIKAKKNNYEQSKIIIKKLKSSFAKRGLQADEIKSNMLQSPYTNIVCGDFNDIPSSYTYFNLRTNLNDAFLDKGFGFGRTYQGISPVLRIDNIFYDAQKWRLLSFQKIDVNYSDHYPIIACLQNKYDK